MTSERTLRNYLIGRLTLDARWGCGFQQLDLEDRCSCLGSLSSIKQLWCLKLKIMCILLKTLEKCVFQTQKDVEETPLETRWGLQFEEAGVGGDVIFSLFVLTTNFVWFTVHYHLSGMFFCLFACLFVGWQHHASVAPCRGSLALWAFCEWYTT